MVGSYPTGTLDFTPPSDSFWEITLLSIALGECKLLLYSSIHVGSFTGPGHSLPKVRSKSSHILRHPNSMTLRFRLLTGHVKFEKEMRE
jgi:hypothetical protein